MQKITIKLNHNIITDKKNKTELKKNKQLSTITVQSRQPLKNPAVLPQNLADFVEDKLGKGAEVSSGARMKRSCIYPGSNRALLSYSGLTLNLIRGISWLGNHHNPVQDTEDRARVLELTLDRWIVSDVRHVQIFPVPYGPFIRALASLRYLIDYLAKKC